MQQLTERLGAIDPAAGEELKIIAYFDVLVDGHASAEVLVRGAAVLSGAAAGYADGRSGLRVDPQGVRGPAGLAGLGEQWPRHRLHGGGVAWLEREGAPGAHDEMILERLTLGLSSVLDRLPPGAPSRGAIEILLHTSLAAGLRAAAAEKAGLDRRPVWFVIAQPATTDEIQDRRCAVLVTDVGAVRATVTDRLPGRLGRAGVGLPGSVDSLPDSWRDALLSLRLTCQTHPVVHAGEAGTLLLLAQAADRLPGAHPDLLALIAAAGPEPAVVDGLDAWSRSRSLRDAAAAAGVHHSTMQVRVATWSRRLGWDIRTGEGRTRLSLAVALYRLANNRF